MIRFGQLDYEIAQCEQHLDATGKRNTEAETYFVRYLLVRICAEYEGRIRALVQSRCTRINDKYLLKFAQSWAAEATKRFKVSDITGMLKGFGEDYKQSFSNAVNGQPCNTAWDSIYINRHVVAHGNGAVMMTLGEFRNAYRDSVTVIDALVKALCMKPKELKGLT